MKNLLFLGTAAFAQDIGNHHFIGYFNKGWSGDKVEWKWDGVQWAQSGNKDWQGEISSFKVGRHTKVQLCYQNDCGYVKGDYATEFYGPLEVPDMRGQAGWASGIKLSGMETEEPSLMLF